MGVQNGEIGGPDRLSDIFHVGDNSIGKADLERHLFEGPKGIDAFLRDDRCDARNGSEQQQGRFLNDQSQGIGPACVPLGGTHRSKAVLEPANR